MVFVLLTLLSMISGSIHVAANGISLFFMAEEYSILCVRVCVCMCVCIYIHIYKPDLYPLVDGYLGCVLVLAVVNNAAVNTGVHVSLNYTFV